MGKNKYTINVKQESGITMIALVFTLIILLILSTVSINALLGEDGILKQARESKSEWESDIETNDKNTKKIINDYDSEMANTEVTYVDDVLPAEPKLSDGMIPVKWNGSNWVKTDASDSEWYDYSEKRWANVVLSDATFQDNILVESSSTPYTQLVWIPRFAYKITSDLHYNSSSGGNIDVVFLDEYNRARNGVPLGDKASYPSTLDSGSSSGKMNDYVIHPAFVYGTNNLRGFWVGKYETSHTGCTTSSSTGTSSSDTTSKTLMIRAGVTSWRNIKITNMFDVCKNMNSSGNVYGLNTSDTVVDPHLMKNTEWGAVAYLSKSIYGKNSSEVWKNNNSSYLTGHCGTGINTSSSSSTYTYKDATYGGNASTSGTIEGVYDMNGGGSEYTASYVRPASSSSASYTNGKSLVDGERRYKDIYSVANSESQSNNHSANSNKYGDAVYEISSQGTGTSAWYGDTSSFPTSSSAFFVRGGYIDDSSTGIYYYNAQNGAALNYATFRLVLPVL